MPEPTNILPAPDLFNKNSFIEFSSLLHLRWGAIICQVLLIIIVGTSFHIPIPYLIVSAILLFETASNLLFHYIRNQNKFIPDWLFAIIMFVDVGLLTILLSQTGGTMNPFTFLYLLHIVIGAILLPPVWAWGLTFFTVLCYSSFFIHAPDSLHQLLHSSSNETKAISVDTHEGMNDTAEKMDLHLKGMLVAFSITSFFVVYFIGRIRHALADHNKMLAQLEDQRLRNEKLTSLATLAAGTAHEFATPLSTIKLATGEMLYSMGNQDDNNELMDDLHLIRSQVDKCEEILHQMTEDAGDPRGANFENFSIQDLFGEVLDMLPEESRSRVTTEQIAPVTVRAPFITICRALKGIITNALDATQDSETPKVCFSSWSDGAMLLFSVTDNGTGMDRETYNRATEPFYTTKETGQGMGLGLFVAKSVAERFGGFLNIESTVEKGTKVIWSMAFDKVK